MILRLDWTRWWGGRGGGGAGCGRGEAEQRLPSFMIDFFVKDQGSRIGSRVNQGSRMKVGGRTRRPARQDPEDQGSRIKDLVGP